MKENGAELAWMIDPFARTVTVYRPGSEPEVMSRPEVVRGEDPVAGFALQMSGSR